MLITNTTFAQLLNQSTPWLGARIDKGKQGSIIRNIIPDSPSFHGKLKVNDEIISIDNKKVSNPKELISEIQGHHVGEEVLISLIRDSKILKLKVLLKPRLGTISLSKKMILNKPIPKFNATIVKTKKDYSFQKGKVTIIKFWATWCPSCIASIPIVSKFSQDNPNINILSISDEEIPLLNKFLRKSSKATKPKNIKYLQSKDAGSVFYASSIPFFVVIDKNGDVVDVEIGSGKILINLLERAKKLNNQKS